MTPAQLVSSMQALATFQLLCVADLGVSEASAAGRASAWADQSGNARNYATAAATNEPLFTSADATLGGRASLSGNGVDRYFSNAYNQALPGTQPFYRLSVGRLDTYVAARAILYQAQTNRLGMRQHPTIRACGESLNPTIGGRFDVPTQRWCIIEEYFSGSTSDFTVFGPEQNVSTGVNLGNTDPASFNLFASNVPAQYAAASCSFSSIVNGLPSAPVRASMRALLGSYYPQAVQTRKVARVCFAGDSIERGANATSDNGYKNVLYNHFFATLGYPVYAVGSTTSGTLGAEWNRHAGISGNKIADCYTYLLDGATGQLRVGGPLENSIQCLALKIGTNDMGTYVPTTTANEYAALLADTRTRQPDMDIAVTPIPPQGPGGNNGNVIAFNAELPAVWDAFDAANPTRTLKRWNANAALGGSWNPALMGDDLHPNDAGHAAIAAGFATDLAPYFNTLTTF